MKESDILPVERRTNFLELVFWNIHDIIAVHTGLRDALNTRQKSHAVVKQVGDILLDAIPHFSPYVSYGAHQLYGKYEFEKEKSSNPAFSAFVEVRKVFHRLFRGLLTIAPRKPGGGWNREISD